MDWSGLYPEAGSREVEMADIGCGYGGLLVGTVDMCQFGSYYALQFLSMKTTCLIIFFVVALAQSLPYYPNFNQVIHYSHRPKYLVLDPEAILECGTYGSNKWRRLICGRHLVYLPPKASNLELFVGK